MLIAELAALPASSARRPRYGGTLRVEIGAAISSLDPGAASADSGEVTAKAQIALLLYDHRNSDGTYTEPGPFRVAEWEPTKHLTLSANDDYRGGRPFVDAVEIRFGRKARERVVDLEVNNTDLAEIPAEQARRAAENGMRISTSVGDELVALVFVGGRPAVSDARVREAIADSIDREAIVNFILQREGDAAGGLLPQWSSGTAFLFGVAPNGDRAKELWREIAPSPKIVLGYDADDSQEQAIAERIVVNAREAGITLIRQGIVTGAAAPNVDAKILRLTMTSRQPQAALADFLDFLAPIAGLTADPLPDRASPEQIYELQKSITGSFSVVPIAWIPQVYGLSARVRDWQTPGPGEAWPLANVWLDTGPAGKEPANP